MDLQALVNSNQHRFSETEREILAFMLENEEFLAEATISSLAHKTFTSTSSIIRLTKKLDFTGFAELKYFVKNSLSQIQPAHPDFVRSGQEDISKTLEALERTDLTEVIQKIHSARTVYLFGTGYAQRNAIQEFAKSLLACGKFTHVIPAKSEFAGSTDVMRAEDVVMIVSLSGNTESVVETIRALSLRKIPMIAVTSQSVNYMASTADHALYYEATPTRLAKHKNPYHSFIALNVLLDYLVRKYIDFLENEV